MNYFVFRKFKRVRVGIKLEEFKSLLDSLDRDFRL